MDEESEYTDIVKVNDQDFNALTLLDKEYSGDDGYTVLDSIIEPVEGWNYVGGQEVTYHTNVTYYEYKSDKIEIKREIYDDEGWDSENYDLLFYNDKYYDIEKVRVGNTGLKDYIELTIETGVLLVLREQY